MQATTGIENFDVTLDKKKKENEEVYKADGDSANPVTNFFDCIKGSRNKKAIP